MQKRFVLPLVSTSPDDALYQSLIVVAFIKEAGVRYLFFSSVRRTDPTDIDCWINSVTR